MSFSGEAECTRDLITVMQDKDNLYERRDFITTKQTFL